MRRRLSRAERIAVAVWIVIPIIVGNTIYDLIVTRAVEEYLMRVAQHEAGRGPLVSMGDVMAPRVFDATWIGLLFGSVVALAGFVTIRMLTAGRNTADPPHTT